MLNLIKEQDRDNLIDKIYLYTKDLIEPKYEFLIKKCENPGIKHLNDLKEFIKHSTLVFITQSYFSFRREARLNSTHWLIMKIHNKRQLQNIATNHSGDIDYKGFIKIYRKCTSKPYYFLIIDSTLPANNLLKFWKNLLHLL